MKVLHVINRRNPNGYGLLNLDKSQDEKDVYFSGYWRVSKDDAEALIGGQLYLHETKATLSTFGGEISRHGKLWRFDRCLDDLCATSNPAPNTTLGTFT